jgi:hypothetical protein
LKQGASIAAYIYPPLNELFGPVITEGKVYYLTYYWVKPSSKTYKPVNNKISINFTKWSTLQECINVPDNFPRYAYSLTPYNELRTRIDRKDSFTGTKYLHCLYSGFIMLFELLTLLFLH